MKGVKIMKWTNAFWWLVMLLVIVVIAQTIFGMNKFESGIYAFIVSIAYDIHYIGTKP